MGNASIRETYWGLEKRRGNAALSGGDWRSGESGGC